MQFGRAWIRIGLMTVLLVVLGILFGFRTMSASPETYPKTALRTAWIDKWFTILDSAEFVSGFDLVYTTSRAPLVLSVIDSLEDRSLAVPHFVSTLMPTVGSIIDCDDCIDEQHTSYLNNWYYDWAKYNWRDLARVAVFHNLQEGVDWRLLDTGGYPMIVWNSLVLNYSPWCPKGTWDGVVTKGNNTWRFGSTEGLTLTEWVCTVARDSLFLENEEFLEAFVGIHLEDGLTRFAPLGAHRPDGTDSSHPDPKGDQEGFSTTDWHNCWTTYMDSTRVSMDSLFVHFLQPLVENGVRVLGTGHDLRWYLEPNTSCYEDTLRTDTFMGYKMEDFGRWGAWPADSLPAWLSAYEGIEDIYHPTGVDEDEGWDVSIVESTPDSGCTVAHRDQWTRANLAICLMGDGYFDGQAYRQDEAFHRFLGPEWQEWTGDSAYAPYGIPEKEFLLGDAVDDYGSCFPFGQIKPLHYRHFRRSASTPMNPMEYTVVINLYDQALGGVPAEDAMWYQGHHSTFPQPDSLLIFNHWRGRDLDISGASVRETLTRVDQRDTRMMYRLTAPADVSWSVYDVGGRLVREVLAGRQSIGDHELRWDGMDGRGQRTPPGVYFWSLKVGQRAQRGRIVIFR